MSKKEELKKVFQFIADYLTEDEVIEIKEEKVEKELLIEETNNTLTKLKTPLDTFGVTAEHIKDLMDRIDEKRVEEAKTKNLLSNQRKEFQDEIKKVKEIAIEKILESKKEEELSLTGVTLSVLNNDFSNLTR
jgi:Asp-tRNA(Asn)/Glu-tRNA(Gln) amidotransferase B subunit